VSEEVNWKSLLWRRRHKFQSIHPPWASQYTSSETDRRKDVQTIIVLC